MNRAGIRQRAGNLEKIVLRPPCAAGAEVDLGAGSNEQSGDGKKPSGEIETNRRRGLHKSNVAWPWSAGAGGPVNRIIPVVVLGAGPYVPEGDAAGEHVACMVGAGTV